MASTKIRIGSIGVGQIGKAHLNGYKNNPNVELVAVADVNAAEVERVAQEYGIPQTYTDFRDLLAREDIDAVDVCLHNNLHMPVTVAVLESGKHAYCEKPMAGSYTDAKTMLDTARRLGRKLHIQLGTLYSLETRVAKQLIDDGQLGKVYHARSTGFRRRGRPYVDGYGTSSFVQQKVASGGALYDMGVYHIAAMLYLMGNPAVQRVTGKTYQETDMDEERRQNGGYDVEELGLGFVKFAGGVTLDIIESWAIHLDTFEGSSIVGSKGGIRLEPFGFYTSLGDLNLNTAINLRDVGNRWHDLRENVDAYDGSQAHWIAALQGRVPLLPTAELALNTMLISEGIYLSNKLERDVSAAEVAEMSVSTAISPVPVPVAV